MGVMTNTSLVEAILDCEAQESRENTDTNAYEIIQDVFLPTGRRMLIVATPGYVYER